MPRRRGPTSLAAEAEPVELSPQLQEFSAKLEQRISKVASLLDQSELSVAAWTPRPPAAPVTAGPSSIGSSGVGEASSTADDFRLNELCDKDYDEALQVRRALARRSLALEFTEWERQQCPIPRLELLCADPARDWLKGREEAHPTYEEFARADRFINKNAAVGGVKAGLKVLVIERLFGNPTITVLLACSHREIRSLRYQDLKALVRLLSKAPDVTRLAESKFMWFANCYEIYHGRKPPYPLYGEISPKKIDSKQRAQSVDPTRPSLRERRQSEDVTARRARAPVRPSPITERKDRARSTSTFAAGRAPACRPSCYHLWTDGPCALLHDEHAD